MIAIRCRFCGRRPKINEGPCIVDKSTGITEGYIMCDCPGMMKLAYEEGATPAPFLIMTIQWGKHFANKSEDDAIKVWNDIQAYGTIRT